MTIAFDTIGGILLVIVGLFVLLVAALVVWTIIDEIREGNFGLVLTAILVTAVSVWAGCIAFNLW